MKKAIYLILVSTIISIFLTIACTIEPVEAETVYAVNMQKGKPSAGLTAEEVQLMIDSSIKAFVNNKITLEKGLTIDYNFSNSEETGLYYIRRETLPSQYLGIKFLEEISDRDYVQRIYGGGGFSEIFMDGNGGDSDNNLTFTLEGNGAYSKYWQTQNWFMINQSNGIYNLADLKTFNTNEEAKVYFSSKNWSRNNTLYKTPDGTVKATY